MGPKKDIVGLWQQGRSNEGMRFGVSDHLWISLQLVFHPAMADKTGPLAGVPYDGTDPQYSDLYM